MEKTNFIGGLQPQRKNRDDFDSTYRSIFNHHIKTHVSYGRWNCESNNRSL